MGKQKKSENKNRLYVLWADLKIVGLISHCIRTTTKTVRVFKQMKELNFSMMNHVGEIDYDKIGYVYFKVVQPELFVQKKLQWKYDHKQAEITVKKLTDDKDNFMNHPYSCRQQKMYRVTYKIPIKIFEIMVAEDVSITEPVYCNTLSALRKILMYCISPSNIELRDKDKKLMAYVLINEY